MIHISFNKIQRNKHETLQKIMAAMFYHAQGMLVNLKMIPSFQAAKYTLGVVTSVGDQFDASKQAKMSLFQFGFFRKKQKDNEREEGREVEEVREAKKTNLEEISTEKPGTKYEGKRVRKYQTTWETDFPWLMFEADKNKMYCKVCRQSPSLADITSSLYTGTGSFFFFFFAILTLLTIIITLLTVFYIIDR